jgi:hypothetical protein
VISSVSFKEFHKYQECIHLTNEVRGNNEEYDEIDLIQQDIRRKPDSGRSQYLKS